MNELPKTDTVATSFGVSRITVRRAWPTSPRPPDLFDAGRASGPSSATTPVAPAETAGWCRLVHGRAAQKSSSETESRLIELTSATVPTAITTN